MNESKTYMLEYLLSSLKGQLLQYIEDFTILHETDTKNTRTQRNNLNFTVLSLVGLEPITLGSNN